MCPACGEPMLAMELDGIEIDHCLACRGTWLDRGEIEMIAMRAGVDTAAVDSGLRHQLEGPKSPHRCPRCRRKMRRVRVGEGGPVEIDACRFDHGHWFDQGELLQFIQCCSTGGGAAVARFFKDMFRSELMLDARGA